jgi:hypothetical protein
MLCAPSCDVHELCRKIRQVDIAPALAELPDTTFVDTGGSNGHIASPEWAKAFARSLELGEVHLVLVRKLPAGQGIPPHIDTVRGRANIGRRYHVPLVTHPLVTMRWPEDGEEHHLEAGWLYEVDYTRLHEIVHRAPIDRIHVQVNAS